MHVDPSGSWVSAREDTLIPPLMTEYLRCPHCAAALSPDTQGPQVQCANGHAFAYRYGVVDFSGVGPPSPLQQRSTLSFQREWTDYYSSLGWRENEFEVEQEMFLTYTRAMPNFFADKVVVDAGCGNGRYVRIVNRLSSPRPKVVMAVDLSDSIFVAARNCTAFDNVIFMKIDVNVLPKVLKRPVDYVYSIGVLHHTPDAHASFCSLARCLGGDGFLSAFIYGRGNRLLERVNRFLRNRFFRHWPHSLVYGLCVLVAIPGQVFRLKFVGPWMLDFVTRFVFVSPDVHNMFDAYTAGWTSFHDKEEVKRWYRENGMDCVVDSQLNNTSLYCIGRKVSGIPAAV
jgi:SAM-dependent methyltransferase